MMNTHTNTNTPMPMVAIPQPKRILLLVDFSEHSIAATQFVVDQLICPRLNSLVKNGQLQADLGAQFEVTVLHSVDYLPPFSIPIVDTEEPPLVMEEEQEEALFKAAHDECVKWCLWMKTFLDPSWSHLVSIIPETLYGDPRESSLQLLSSFAFDFMVVGSHGKGRIKSMILGSVSKYLVHHAPCPVVVVKINLNEKKHWKHPGKGVEVDVGETPGA